MVRLRVEPLPSEEEVAKRRHRVFRCKFAVRVLFLDGADRSRGGEQGLDTVLRDHPPERAGVRGAYGLALVEHGRGAHQQRRVHDVGVSDHPADIGGGPPHLTGRDVVHVRHRPAQGDGVAAVVAHDPLRLTRRTRGVEDVQRICRGHLLTRGRLAGAGLDRGVPVDVATGGHLCQALGALLDDQPLGLV